MSAIRYHVYFKTLFYPYVTTYIYIAVGSLVRPAGDGVADARIEAVLGELPQGGRGGLARRVPLEVFDEQRPLEGLHLRCRPLIIVYRYISIVYIVYLVYMTICTVYSIYSLYDTVSYIVSV